MKRFLTLRSISGSNSLVALALLATYGCTQWNSGAFERGNKDSLSTVAANTREELLQIQYSIENHVRSKVLWDDNHQLCREGLLGAYMPYYDTMVNCVANHDGDDIELVMTAKHEGWHAVQTKCNDGRAALRDEQIRAHLNSPVKNTLRHSYHPKDHRQEAEARVVEQIPTANYIRGIKAYCRHLFTKD